MINIDKRLADEIAKTEKRWQATASHLEDYLVEAREGKLEAEPFCLCLWDIMTDNHMRRPERLIRQLAALEGKTIKRVWLELAKNEDADRGILYVRLDTE